MDKEKYIELNANIELAKREFFFYCNLMLPSFYKEDREYLIRLCKEFQDFYYSDDDVLITNAPPRHGKSISAQKFTEWVLGEDPTQKIMTGSYNERLSSVFSKNVRNTIMEVKADTDKVVYSDIFPNTRIKQGDASMSMWSLEGSYNNYLATSPSGTATGFGCSLMIIDDLIKNAEERYNDNVLEKQWDWFVNTMLSRLEEGGKIIIIMTRWASNDLRGRALKHFEEIGMKVRHINMKALQDDGTMLCDDVLSRKSYDMKVASMGRDIASANYQQIPIDLEGRLYERFLEYDEIPRDDTGTPLFSHIKNYTDTADEGSDYLCSICYGIYERDIYVLDVLYTKKSMEVTEKQTAELLYNNDVNRADIESNNGGKGFARNVKRILKEDFPKNKIIVKWFHQSKNKKARILTNSSYVINHVLFPKDWKNKYPEFYNALYSYQREGKNKNDDAPDALTGCIEKAFSGGVKVIRAR